MGTVSNGHGPAPSAGDIFFRAKHEGFRRLTAAGRVFGPGEARWREQLDLLGADERAAVWRSEWLADGDTQTPGMATRSASGATVPRNQAFEVWRTLLEMGGLGASPHAEPVARQVWIVDQALARVRAELELPADFEIDWRDGDPGTTYGTAAKLHGCFVMLLNVNTPPNDLERVVFHEARHLADYAAGLNLDNAESERRAMDFACSMLERFSPCSAQ